MEYKLKIDNYSFTFLPPEPFYLVYNELVWIIRNDEKYVIPACDLFMKSYRGDDYLDSRYCDWRFDELEKYKSLYLSALEKYNKLIVIK